LAVQGVQSGAPDELKVPAGHVAQALFAAADEYDPALQGELLGVEGGGEREGSKGGTNGAKGGKKKR